MHRKPQKNAVSGVLSACFCIIIAIFPLNYTSTVCLLRNFAAKHNFLFLILIFVTS